MSHETAVVDDSGQERSLVLASASPWRRSILAAAGVRCVLAEAQVDEASIGGDGPVEVARARALAKARDVADRFPAALVIGADQVVHLDGEAIGKPGDTREWMARLKAFRGRTHALTTAVALVEPDRPPEVFAVHSGVRFRSDVTDEELAAYIQFGEAAGCAGGYMVEQRGAWLVEAIDGDWTNVVGLPVFSLITRLRARGYRLSPAGVGYVPGPSRDTP